jgi:phosphoribosylaminoimidazole carboxylase (NCAIR synthetase)
MVIILKDQKFNKAFYKNPKKEVAEYQRINGKAELERPLLTLKLRAIQKIGTGET